MAITKILEESFVTFDELVRLTMADNNLNRSNTTAPSFSRFQFLLYLYFEKD